MPQSDNRRREMFPKDGEYAVGTFANYYIAPANLSYQNGALGIYDKDWRPATNQVITGLTNGSYFFNTKEVGTLTGIPYNGRYWDTLPADVCDAIIGSSRAGSTINGVSGCRYAILRLSNYTYFSTANPLGVLFAPDGFVINNMPRTFIWNAGVSNNDNVTLSELNKYLKAGCAFLCTTSGHYMTTAFSGYAMYCLNIETKGLNRNGKDRNLSINCRLASPAPTFGGLMIAPAPLYYDGSNYIIKDNDWNHSSYEDQIYGDVEGSYYFNWNNVNSVSNIWYDKYYDWRLPTRAEWCTLTTGASPGTSRNGSTVNGNSGVKFAKVQLTGVTHAGNSTPLGLLLFPDGLTITGKALTNYKNSTASVTTGVTGSELQAYLDQGCVFLPASGHCYNGSWNDAGTNGNYWSSSGYNSNYGYDLYFVSSLVSPSNYVKKADYYYSCRLVRTAS